MTKALEKLVGWVRVIWWFWSSAAHRFFSPPWRELKSILFKDPMRQTRLWLALSSLTWAFLLSGNDVTFSDARTTYHVMRALMPENTWAFIFGLHGVLGLWTLLWKCKRDSILTTEALVGAMVWTSSTIACFAAHWPRLPSLNWIETFHQYVMPAAMSGEFWLSVAAWLRLVLYWADVRNLKEERDNESNRCRH